MNKTIPAPPCLTRPLFLHQLAVLFACGATALAATGQTPPPSPARSASGSIRIENPQEKADLATRIDEAIQRAKTKNAPTTSAGGRRRAEPIPSVEVRIPAERPSKPAKTMAIPQAPARPAVQDPEASRRYIQTRAAELAAAVPPPPAPPPPDPRTVRWDYGSGDRGPKAWGNLHPEFAACSQGMRQSPIHITAQDVEAGPAPLLAFDHRFFGGTVLHSGHGLELKVEGDSILTLRGMPWRLVRLQFRHPAEERVHQHNYPMATDLVYQGPEGQTAVVSVPMQLGSTNAFITRIWTHMPLDVQDSVRLPQPVLSVDDLLPQDRRYYQYAGSITQPPCTEGVLRIVMKNPVNIGLAQLRLLQRVSPPNARPVQASNGRLVREAQ